MPRGIRKADPRPTGPLKGDWKDISSESQRTYIYGDGERFTIKAPAWLNVDKRGEDQHPKEHRHRVKTTTGLCYYVRPGWLSIEWITKPGSKDFDF